MNKRSDYIATTEAHKFPTTRRFSNRLFSNKLFAQIMLIKKINMKLENYKTEVFSLFVQNFGPHFMVQISIMHKCNATTCTFDVF